MNIWMMLSLICGILICINFFNSITKRIAFIELFLMLYAINYLIAPVYMYSLPSSISVAYPMLLPPEQYFPIAILGMASMIAGLYLPGVPPIFTINIKLLKIESILNEKVLKQWVIWGTLLYIFSSYYISSEIGFIVYLMAMVRFVGAFSLFILNPKANKWYIIAVLLVEFFFSLRYGMFHDIVMWLILFAILYMYVLKVNLIQKIGIIVVGITLIFFVQSAKVAYRELISEDKGGLSNFIETTSNSAKVNEDNFWESENVIIGVTRINQGWILASTINNMDRLQIFEGLNLVGQYLEAAIMPRFLDPHKLKAGEKGIFVKYSGHNIGDNTSMGLGVFSDGYIAYGTMGIFLFGFGFGLLFNLIFRIAHRWASISPFFFLFTFPVLNYAIRADCELQTVMGFIIKSLLAFSILVWYYSYYFKKRLKDLQKQISEQLNGETSIII